MPAKLNRNMTDEELREMERTTLQMHKDAKAALAEREATDLWEMAITKLMVKLVKNSMELRDLQKSEKPPIYCDVELPDFKTVEEVQSVPGYHRLVAEISTKYNVVIFLQYIPENGTNWGYDPAYVRAVFEWLGPLHGEREKILNEILEQVRNR